MVSNSESDAAPATARKQSLPTSTHPSPLTVTAPLLLRTQELTWEALEHLVVALAVEADGAQEARPFGRGGQAQDGVDVVAFFASGVASVYQAKRYEKFTASDLRKAVHRYTDGARPFSADRIVVVTTAEVRDTQIDLELVQLRSEHGGIKIELWGRQQLSDMLFPIPDLVRRFFGEETMRTFCRPPITDQVPPFGTRLIGDLKPGDALRFEVHPALDGNAKTASLPPLPPYIARPMSIDEQLRQEVAAARTGNRMVLLIGGSSNGKTRACWEAVRSTLPDWLIHHPLEPDRPTALLNALRSRALQPNTVLWLNEAQAYLLDKRSDEVASALQSLLTSEDRGPILILGTMWPKFSRILEAGPDVEEGLTDASPIQQLADFASWVTMPSEFTKEQLISADSIINSDPRLKFARSNAENRQIAQFLAGAQQLKRRYQHSDTAGRAIVTAAIDARRAGHGRLLREDFLKAAAEGYIDDESWHGLEDDWFSARLSDLTAQHRNLPGPLTRHRPRRGEPPTGISLYFLADYLDETGRRERAKEIPAPELWNAAGLYSHTTADLINLGREARRYGATHCMDLYLKADAAGLKDTLRWFSHRLITEQRFSEAEQVIHDHCPDSALYAELGGSLFAAGNRARGEHLVRRAFDMSGNTTGARRLGHHLSTRGLKHGAERIYTWAAEADDLVALAWLAQRREALGDRTTAERYARRAMLLGNPEAVLGLAQARGMAGKMSDAERLCSTLAEDGHGAYLARSAEDLLKRQNYGMALICYQAASTAGNPQALEWMSWRSDGQGSYKEAEVYAFKAAAVGYSHALHTLAHLRFAKGRLDDATRLNVAAAEAGSSLAAAWLHRRARPA